MINKDNIKDRKKWKRFIARHFLRYYVGWLLHTRSGRTKLRYYILNRKEKEFPKCKDCGICCANCICLDIDSGKCKIWGDAMKYSLKCHLYPLSPVQLYYDDAINKCRYYWDDKGADKVND